MKDTVRVCVLYPAAIALGAALAANLRVLHGHRTLWFVVIHQSITFGWWFSGSLVPFLERRRRRGEVP